ncbi:MAG TPA: DinB family protein [Leptospiraceae bacterium]|nr:DinB family protein [Leptospirales bacterium]HMU83583.1 DinB family protein [Leptospiraceae bacterium]HMW59837.1 DinB family protein [Leptospiraceae bacterium]HMX58392.1 DinB family protein [Leptospiraceae bacterium]HMY45591.1 DinB family protein [Leptospiraceae bacterium]
MITAVGKTNQRKEQILSRGLAVTLHILDQGRELLAKLTQEDYSARSPLGASVGSHMRHILDFYRCFLRDEPAGSIDYDLRERNSESERLLDLARRELELVRERLRGLRWTENEPVQVKVEASHPVEFVTSTREREIQFLISHTVHHFALISYILAERGFAVPADFGIAPSTLEFLRAESLAG